MCDYSLQSVASRPAKVGDKLKTRNFGTGTRGFCSVDDASTVVCLLPGTELAFDKPVLVPGMMREKPKHTTAIFRQINQGNMHTHHDALEYPDGSKTLLTYLADNQRATVLQLPAKPKTEQEAKDQERLAVVG